MPKDSADAKQRVSAARRALARLAVGSAAALALVAATGSGAEAQQADEGRKVYNRVCAACHQADGTGVPGTFPPVANSEWVTSDKGRLIRIILHGMTGEVVVDGETYSGMMPPWGAALKDPEVAAVATYVRNNFGNKASAVTAAEVASVRAATASRKTPWTAKELIAATVKEK